MLLNTNNMTKTRERTPVYHRVRSAVFAGSFYPLDPDELAERVVEQIEEADPGDATPKAIITPHAGYIYSGPVAASAYARLAHMSEYIRRVVLLGPSHHVAFKGLALPSASHFETPLGAVEIDMNAIHNIQSLSQVNFLDSAHQQEHSLEVQLPFLQTVLTKFKLLPLVVGDATPEEVGEIIELLWGGPETLFVISSDLSHFHDYDTARRIDQHTSEKIVGLSKDLLGGEEACGCRPVNGLLNVARKRNLQVEMLDLRNSGDTAGKRDRVVGYGAFAFY